MSYNKTIIEEVQILHGSGKKVNMSVSKKQQASVNKYVKANYDRINVTMPKGQREVIKAHADALNESVNGFINRAIAEAMERDRAATGPQDTPNDG